MKADVTYDPTTLGYYLKVFMGEGEVSMSKAATAVTEVIVKELAAAWLEKNATALIDSIDPQAINMELRRMVAARMMSK